MFENGSSTQTFKDRVTGSKPCSLIDIIEAPEDENCLYARRYANGETDYFQARKRRVKFQDREAIAVQLVDMSQYIKTLTLESAVMLQKNRNTSLQNYAAMSNHEFRTPLATILMLLQTLMAMKLHSQANHYLKLIYGQISLLLNLTNGILDVTLLQMGKFEFKTAPFDLYHVLNNMLMVFEPQSEAQQTRISYTVVSKETFLQVQSASENIHVLPD